MSKALQLLRENEQKDMLRFVTAGSVDDGKSTLIGRLLFESKGIYEDQLDSLKSASGRYGTTGEEIDWALLTDGLKSEREQGITIDVAYRYFSTPKRKFIIADSPGHEQYTRNMATGASTASLAIILIDASQGVLVQSKRHAFITSLLGIPHVAVAVNKMDLVDYSEDVYKKIVRDFTEFSARLDIGDMTFFPISALKGDNIVTRSPNTPWYEGNTLLHHLENVHIASDRNLVDLRLPVQLTHRPDRTFRGYMTTASSGVVRPGDEIMVLPSGVKSRVKKVLSPDGEIEAAFPPLSAIVTLEDEIDISRGDMLVHPHNLPTVDRRFEAMVVWMSEQPMKPGTPYVIKHTTQRVPGTISELRYQVDVNTLRREQSAGLNLNEIGRCVVETARPVCYDAYKNNRSTGAFIVIDRITNNTVGAGMIIEREQSSQQMEPQRRVTEVRSQNIGTHASPVTEDERSQRLGQKPATVWLTGLTGSGKTTIAYAVERRLFDMGKLAHVLDGENVRQTFNKDLGFDADDRAENMRRSAEVAGVFNDAGLISVCSFLSPYEEDRERARQAVGPERFIEVYLTAPVQVCRQRRPEVYAKADSGEIPMFSGVTAPYEAPLDADLELPTHKLSVDQAVDKILDVLRSRGAID